MKGYKSTWRCRFLHRIAVRVSPSKGLGNYMGGIRDSHGVLSHWEASYCQDKMRAWMGGSWGGKERVREVQ